MSPILPKSIQCTRQDKIFSDCSTTDQDTSQCQHVAGVICEGLWTQLNFHYIKLNNYIYHVHTLVNVMLLSPAAPCLSNGFTDCNDCGTVSCMPRNCDCSSNCYESGNCCPDVAHVDNCLRECNLSQKVALCNKKTWLYQQLWSVKRGRFVWWVE